MDRGSQHRGSAVDKEGEKLVVMSVIQKPSDGSIEDQTWILATNHAIINIGFQSMTEVSLHLAWIV